MMGTFFQHINSEVLRELIAQTKTSLCYAAPGIQEMPATEIVALSKNIGPELISIFLDIDENVLRMGYGTLEAIKLLQDNGVKIQHISGLRNGLIVSDDIGFSYTPTALFLEKEEAETPILNAMRLMPEQIREAMARLSPASKVIALAQAQTDEEIKHIQELVTEIQPEKLNIQQLKEIQENLTSAPPIKFDIARQVRVFQPHFQYVELSLTGAAIQRNKLNLPRSIQKIGMDKELEGRLKTTFDLLDKNGSASSQALEKELREIRENFTPSLGKNHGRVILKKSLSTFEKRIAELREKIEEYQKTLAGNLERELEKSKEMIVNYYLPVVQKNIPDHLYGTYGDNPTDENIEKWLSRELNKAFPTAESLVQKIQLDVNYKDVTFDTLNREDFLESIQKAYPDKDWEKAYKEFRAAGESK
ncbi:hypothetical protein [Acinetobacter harbinensis]|uniref:hypothetical protein n=1 Tax=Acinetobacter harbinensis TaxID=1353941 RepID=UPI001C4EE5C0|nr:hypothetical protein [Acinetobacter harbinensis]